MSQRTGGQITRLAEALQRLFGALGEETLREIAGRVDWLHLRSGDRLITQGLKTVEHVDQVGRFVALA